MKWRGKSEKKLQAVLQGCWSGSTKRSVGPKVDVQKVKAIFTEASALVPREARAAYLDSACANDPALREQVETLLVSQEKLGGFLDPLFSLKTKNGSEAVGTLIGPYRI